MLKLIKGKKFLKRYFVLSILCFLIFFILISYKLNSYYQTHFLPGVKLNQYYLDNLNYKQALSYLNNKVQIPSHLKLTLAYNDFSISSSSGQLNLHYNLEEVLINHLQKQAHFSPLNLIRQFLSKKTLLLDRNLQLKEDMLDEFINLLTVEINQTGELGTIAYNQITKKPEINRGLDEIKLNHEATKKLIMTSFPQQNDFIAIVEVTDYAYTDDEVNVLQNQALALLNKKLNLKTNEINNFSYYLSASDLIPLLNQTTMIKDFYVQEIIDQLPDELKRPPQEPELVLDLENKKAITFTPPLPGLKINKEKFSFLLAEGILNLIANSNNQLDLILPLEKTLPKTNLADINNLGINELIGFGESYYYHSIVGRIFNVNHATEKINFTLVAPGEEFSFNQALGPVSASTGYKPGYIIQQGRSILADGGGVCQVSTTLFRALLDAGLNITLRRPHSYRVSYYELDNDPGFDATVYAGNVDLRFINDTHGYLLIVGQADSKNLYMNIKIYGTNDGRYTKIENYKKYDAIGPPPPEYIIDYSLAPGQQKQIDWAVGGLKTSFTHLVYNQDGSLKSEKKYFSQYYPWSAKYLIGP